MKEKVSEQLDALVFAVTQIIFGPEATQVVRLASGRQRQDPSGHGAIRGASAG